MEGPEVRKAPLVISGLKNRNWREESARRRGQNLLPPEVQGARRAGVSKTEAVEAGTANGTPTTFGLSFVQRSDKSTEVAKQGNSQNGKSNEVDSAEPPPQMTDDELALVALTSEKTSRRSNLILPALDSTQDGDPIGRTSRSTPGLNEDDAFRVDVLSRPDSASLEDYAAVPVEEFGAALLRGMGWKEGDVVGKRKDQVAKARVVERRPALLGIGAKEVPTGVGEELGAWGKAAKGKRRIDTVYSPVLLRNAKTGEMLTEEELKKKVEESKLVDQDKDWRERRDRNLRIDSEKKDRASRGSSRSVVFNDSNHVQGC